MRIMLNEDALKVALQVWVDKCIGAPGKVAPKIDHLFIDASDDEVMIDLDETPPG